MKKFYLLLVFIVCTGITAFSQTPSCAQTLRLARSTFESGRLHELPALLETCLKNGFDATEKVDAYKLLTQAYIYLEEPEKADETMLKLLNTDPEFKPNDAIDPAEFVALYRTFKTNPIYRLGVKAGANTSQPNVKSFDAPNDGDAKYDYGAGFQIGIIAEIPLTKKLTLSPELNFQAKTFKFSNGYFDRNNTSGTENLAWVNLPISLQYQLIEHKLNPYVAGGVAVDYLITAKNNIQTLIEDQSPVTEAAYDEKDLFKKINLSGIVSAGIKTKIKKSMLVVEIRYNYGLMSIINTENLYSNQFSTWDNKFVHGSFSLNTLSLAVSYQFNKYNPKKITR